MLPVARRQLPPCTERARSGRRGCSTRFSCLPVRYSSPSGVVPTRTLSLWQRATWDSAPIALFMLRSSRQISAARNPGENGRRRLTGRKEEELSRTYSVPAEPTAGAVTLLRQLPWLSWLTEGGRG